MKILIVGDLHLRVRPPRRRREADFQDVCLGKLRQIIGIGNDRADAVVQVGDFFDSPDPSKGLLAAVIRDFVEMLGSPRPRWFAVHGQHDLRYHSQEAAGRSALRVLEAAGCVTILPKKNQTWEVLERHWPKLGEEIYGASFGQTPRVLDEKIGDEFRVLVAHAMVGDKPLWPGHDLTGPEQYVRRHPGYDLYCLGDYHYPFSVRVGDAWVINPGAVLRLTADPRDRSRQPKVVLFDTDRGEPEDIPLDAAPEAEAFDLEGYADGAAADEAKASFSAMAEALRQTGKLGVNFRENLAAAMDELEIGPDVRKKVWMLWERLVVG